MYVLGEDVMKKEYVNEGKMRCEFGKETVTQDEG
jgi:hypothetical protein